MTDRVLDNNDKLKGLMYILILFNFLDGLITLVLVETGNAIEYNPLMGLFLSIHPVLFITMKMFLVGFGVLVIWRYRDRPMAVGSMYLCVTAYSLVMLYHGGVLIS